MAAGPEALDRPPDPALAVERPLALPDIEVDAEPFEAGFDPVADAGRRPPAEDGGPVGSRRRRRCPDVVRHGRGERGDVLAVVSVLGDRITSADREHRGTEVLDLG